MPMLVVCALLGACGGASGSRDYVRAVGSGTVYPFATAVAERYARGAPGRKSPVVEATGTGAGMKLFCAGVGAAYPDIADASRRMKPAEYRDCVKHGVTQVVEVQVGIDGIAFAEGKAGPGYALSPAEIYKAIAATPFGWGANTARTWNQVNPALPAIPIVIYGPPTTSGTRDALAELIMAAGCKTDPAMVALEAKDPARAAVVCRQIREDGPFVEATENYNLTVQKLTQNPGAIGIFGYSFLDKNPGTLRGIAIGGVMPSYASIADRTYPGARPLYIYVKAQHLMAVRGLRDYVAEWTHGWGPDGYLKVRGMVVAPDAVRARNAAVAQAMTLLDPRDLDPHPAAPRS